MHQEWDLPNPLVNNYTLTATLKGIRRSLGDPVCMKSPITINMLYKLLSYLDLQDPLHCNIWAAALTMFYAMLRRSNVLPLTATQYNAKRMLRRCDITFDKYGLIIRVGWSKTIQYGERSLQIPLPRIPNHLLCPTQAVYKAFTSTPLAPATGPAFVTSALMPLSASTFLTVLQQALGPGHNISCHSFRRGGATWAFQAGVSIESIKHIGDWKSNAYMRYIQISPKSLRQALLQAITTTTKPGFLGQTC